MTSESEWSPCEPGTLNHLSRQPATSSSQWTRRGILAAVVTAAAGGGVFLMRSEAAAGISCARVAELGPDYVADILPTDQITKIDTHRRKCAMCDAMLSQLEKQRTQQV